MLCLLPTTQIQEWAVMSSQVFLDERLHAYLAAVSLREPEILSRLRAETAQLEMARMQIGPEQGQFMALLLRLMGARRYLEVGTFTGYSALVCAMALPEDGEVYALDISEEWTSIAKAYWREAGLEERIKLCLVDAAATLGKLQRAEAASFDFIFIDADKQNYITYYEMALRLLRKGGMIAVDNTLWSGAVADPENAEPGTRAIRRFNTMLKQDDRVSISLVTIGDGLTLILKEFE
jgi:predicted O-methyltransferase YrrM